ncbi:unnamed protein product, partial [Mesorhabditis spiculigera]
MIPLIIAIIGVLIVPAQAEIRGLAPDVATFYKVGKEFACLDGSLKIPFTQVNDDYCDCPDGSDEPGTSACPNGRFYCQNGGHKPLHIFASPIHFLSDCCDGSDEWGSNVKCSNICNELGRAAREEAERRAEIARKGWAVRSEMARQGQDLKTESEVKVEPLRAEREQLVPSRDELEKKKKEAEDLERSAKDDFRKKWEDEKNVKKRARSDQVFDQLDLNQDGKLTRDDIAKNALFDTNGDGIVDEEEIKVYLTTEEVDKEQFFTQTYDLVKIQMRNQADHQKEEKQAPEELAHEDDLDDLEPEEEKHDDHHDHHDEDDLPMPEYTDEIKALIAAYEKARDDWQEVNTKVSDLDRQINDAESFLQQDFGPDQAWASLKGKCFDLDEGQYTYKMCPFDKTVQKDRHGHSETRLGEFTGWTGKEPRKYSEQMYEKGQQCWNGPQRSTKVIIECGETEQLVEATEPAKCEYQFRFLTPAACNNPDQKDPPHEEL